MNSLQSASYACGGPQRSHETPIPPGVAVSRERWRKPAVHERNTRRILTDVPDAGDGALVLAAPHDLPVTLVDVNLQVHLPHRQGFTRSWGSYRLIYLDRRRRRVRMGGRLTLARCEVGVMGLCFLRASAA